MLPFLSTPLASERPHPAIQRLCLSSPFHDRGESFILGPSVLPKLPEGHEPEEEDLYFSTEGPFSQICFSSKKGGLLAHTTNIKQVIM